MEANETLKTVLWQEAEAELPELLEGCRTEGRGPQGLCQTRLLRLVLQW